MTETRSVIEQILAAVPVTGAARARTRIIVGFPLLSPRGVIESKDDGLILMGSGVLEDLKKIATPVSDSGGMDRICGIEIETYGSKPDHAEFVRRATARGFRELLIGMPML